MPASTKNYFRYFSALPAQEIWGLGVTASGYTEIPAGTAYPPVRHPADHDFTWNEGRRLNALQVVLILSGRGWFETKATGQRAIGPGSAFVALPTVWHRYRPDEGTGWTESWVELRGPTVDRLCKQQVLKPRRAVYRNADASGLGEALESVHACARGAGTSFDPELAARAMGVLAAWTRLSHTPNTLPQSTAAILAAERHLAAHCTEHLNINDLAKQQGVAYSHFRKLFQQHTGFAPWQYVLRLRLVRARRLLMSTDATLESIAEQLGFSSAFHFSTVFKRVHGQSPTLWRGGRRHSRSSVHHWHSQTHE